MKTLKKMNTLKKNEKFEKKMKTLKKNENFEKK